MFFCEKYITLIEILAHHHTHLYTLLCPMAQMKTTFFESFFGFFDFAYIIKICMCISKLN
jgi:hypothetical protein